MTDSLLAPSREVLYKWYHPAELVQPSNLGRAWGLGFLPGIKWYTTTTVILCAPSPPPPPACPTNNFVLKKWSKQECLLDTLFGARHNIGR